MSKEETRELTELKTILTISELSDYGKRRLLEFIEKLESQLDIANKKIEKINAIANDDIKTINEILKESDLSNISDKRGLLNYEKELMSRINRLSIIGGNNEK